MIELPILKSDGVTFDSKLSLSGDVFGCPFKEDLVHQVLLAYQANGHQRTKAQKGRAHVKASGIKPWRQKGTGRARAGSRASPIWRGGGRAFATRPDETKRLLKVNKKMYRLALRSILSEMARQDRLCVLESLSLKTSKTSEALSWLKPFGQGHIYLVATDIDENLYLGCRNLHYVAISYVLGINPFDLVRTDKLLITQKGIEQLEQWLQS